MTGKVPPPPLSPIRLDEENLEEQEPIDPKWEFNKEFFQELTLNAKELYRYEATLRRIA